MFKALPLVKISIITLREREDELLEILGRQASVHLLPARSEGVPNPMLTQIVREEEENAAYEKRLSIIMEQLRLINARNSGERSCPAGGAVFKAQTLDELELKIGKLVREILELERQNNQLQGNISGLEKLSGLNIDIKKWNSLSHIHAKIGQVPERELRSLDSRLNEPDIILLPLARLQDTISVAVISHIGNAERIQWNLKRAFFSESQFPPEFAGTPSEMIGKVKALLDENRNRIKELKNRLSEIYACRREEIIQTGEALLTKRVFLAAKKEFGYTRESVIIFGYIPSAQLHSLKQAIEKSFPWPFEIRTEALPDREEAPVELSNPSVVKPFELISDLYGHPRYNEVDPTPVLAITYPLMFGMMFGDVGQGAVLAFTGWAMARFSAKIGLPSAVGKIAVLCGLASVLFGFLYGSVFGYEDLIHPVLFAPASDMNFFFTIALGFGVFYLLLGLLFSLINLVRKRERGGLIFDKYGIAGLMFYLSLLSIYFGSTLGSGLLLHSGMSLVIFIFVFFVFKEFIRSIALERRVQWHTLHPVSLFENMLEFFELLVGFVSNTVSFIRLAAFAMSHAALMGVVFYVAKALQNTFGYLAVVVAGNLGIIILEGVIVAIQALRLEYYEFFSKFYQGGGVRFSPFTLKEEAE
ncbi:MAG: V-type ATPase 116kDa subunit family protein [Candidatus Wallbacteria bacterium]|nr:V-type ATPase 116kDa subunit family protein [Candidatus Wallbacteria bacterium]